jgi:hypothetical protein
VSKLKKIIWEGVIDYGSLEFQRHPENESRLWEAFDRVSGTPSCDLLV